MKMKKKIVFALAVLAAFMMLAVPMVALISDNVSADDTTGRQAKGFNTTAVETGVNGIYFYVADGFSLSFQDGVGTLSGKASNNSSLDSGYNTTWGRTNGYAVIDINLKDAIGEYEYIWFHVVSTGLSVSAHDKYTCAVGDTASNERIRSYGKTTFSANDYDHDMCLLVPQDGTDIVVEIYGSTTSQAGGNEPGDTGTDGSTNVPISKERIAEREDIEEIASFTIKTSDAITIVDLNSTAAGSVGEVGYPYDYPGRPETDVKFNNNYHEWAYNAGTKTLSSEPGSNVRFDGYLIAYGGTGVADDEMALHGFAIKSNVSSSSIPGENWLYSTHISDLMGTTYDGAPWKEYWTTDSPYLTVVSISDDVDDRNWSAKVDSAGDTSMQTATFYCTWDLNSKKYTASSFDGSVVKNKSMSLVRNCEYTIKDGTINSSVTRNSVPANEYFGYLLFQTYGKVTFSNLTLDVHSVSVPANHGIAAIATKAGEGAVNIQSCDILTGGNADDYAVVASWYADNGGWYTIAPVVNITNTAQQTVNGNIAAGMYTTSQVTPSTVPTLNLVSGAVDGDIVTAIFSENNATYTGTNNYKVIVGENATVTGGMSISQYGIVENSGTITNDSAIICSGAITNNGTIINNGSITLGGTSLANITKVEGQISFNGTGISGGAGSKITWGTKSLTVGSDGAFTAALATVLSPEITAGTVTLDKADVIASQTVTVDASATLVITGAMTVQSEGKIVVNNTGSSYGTVKFGNNVMEYVTKIEGQIAFDGTKTLTAASGSKITWGSETLTATNGTFEIAVDSLDTVIKTGTVTMNDATIDNGQIVTVNSGATLAVTGTLTNAGVINVEGTLTDSYLVESTQMIINTNGTINVAKTGTLKVGYFTGKGVNIDGKINFAAGGKFYNFAGAENKLISSGTDAALIMLSVGNVTIDAKEVGGAVTYTLQKDAKATFTQSNVAGFAFKAGDVIDIDGELTIATMITIPEGAKLNVNGKVTGGENSVIVLDKTATLDIGSSASVSVGTIDMTGSNKGVKAVMIKAGGVITALIDGSTTEAESKANLENIVAGYGGISITKGSVYINGTLATPDATGKITVPAGAVKISGNVEEGVTLEVPAGSSIVIPKDSTLTFEEGSKFNYDNAATITFEEKSSSIIYEKGSEVNDVVIEVETKEDSEGTTVAVHIYLVSENEKKLIISVDYVEVLPGKTYGDALNDVIVTPMKKTVTFDGWYNLAFNEKIRSTDIVGNYDVVLTACYSEEGRVIPVPDDDDDSGSSVVPADNSNINEFALPIAFILLVCSIFALGFVIIRKK